MEKNKKNNAFECVKGNRNGACVSIYEVKTPMPVNEWGFWSR